MHTLSHTSVIVGILSTTSLINLAMAAALPQTQTTSTAPGASSPEQAFNIRHGPNPNAAPQPGSAALDAALENYDYSQIIENKGIPSDLWSVINEQLDEIEIPEIPEDKAFEGCLLNEFGVYRQFGNVRDWIVAEGGPGKSEIDNFRVLTARCIDWMNEFNAQGHTFDDWKATYRYWII